MVGFRLLVLRSDSFFSCPDSCPRIDKDYLRKTESDWLRHYMTSHPSLKINAVSHSKVAGLNRSEIDNFKVRGSAGHKITFSSSASCGGKSVFQLVKSWER